MSRRFLSGHPEPAKRRPWQRQRRESLDGSDGRFCRFGHWSSELQSTFLSRHNRVIIHVRGVRLCAAGALGRPKDRTQPTKLEIPFGHAFDSVRYRRPKALCARVPSVCDQPSRSAPYNQLRINCCGCTRSAWTVGEGSAKCVSTDTPFFVTSSRVCSSTSRIAPVISTRAFFGGASLKRPQPADPVDHVTGSISVPHDAIERLSYLV